MATAMDNNFSRDNSLNETTATTTATTTWTLDSSTSKKSDVDEVPDYNEAFPQLRSAGQVIHRPNAFSQSTYSQSTNGTDAMNNSATSAYSAAKIEEDKRRKMAIHASALTTKIIEIPPEERNLDKNDNSRRAGNNQSSRNTGASNNGQPLQKLCMRIQKQTSTNISFFYKDQSLIVTITGRPEQVRLAQVQIVRELQKPVKLSVNIPLDFHRFIIGSRGTTLRTLEQETATRITVPPQNSQSNLIEISGAKDNVKLCEQKILDLYHTQFNKGFERLNIPYLYHPWIRYQLVDELVQQYHVTIDLPPPIKQTDEITIRGERESVEQAKMKLMQFYKSLEGKIMTFPLEIPNEQHRFILGKKAAGLKEIFDKTNVNVRIPAHEENSSTIQVQGETGKIGEAITMIYKMANAVLAVQIDVPRWIQTIIRGEKNIHLETMKKSHPDVKIFFHDEHINLEGPPEEVERVRTQIQTTIDELKKKNTTYAEVNIDPQFYKQMIGKNQARLLEMQEQTGCEIKFPFDDSRAVKLMGTKESVDKARQLLTERSTKLANESKIELSIDPQYYPQIIGAKHKNLDELRSKYNNIQISFPEANSKSDRVILHGNKDDVEKCSKVLLSKIKDLYSVEINVPKRLHPYLIGKSGSNIQRLREKMPDVRIDVSLLDESKDSASLRLSGKKQDVDKARKSLDEHINELNVSFENVIEQYVTIDSKWHSKFFQNKRKLLNDLQQQYGDMNIKFPERTSNSDQVLLHGPKETLEQIRKRLEELVDTWENTLTKEMTIPHRYHRYLLAHGGTNIQTVQKEFNVQVQFPRRPINNQKDEQEPTTTTTTTTTTTNEDESQKDIVRITGRLDDVDKAIVTLEQMVPVETSVEIPSDAHGSLLGKGGSNLQALNKQYPDVQITFPPQNSSQNTVQLRGQRKQVECVRKELLESYEKFQTDRQARSFEVRFTIKPNYRSIIVGTRGKQISQLRQTYDVKIDINQNITPSSAVVPQPATLTASTNNNDDEQITHEQHDDQQATPQENLSLPTETLNANQLIDAEVVITGYEDKALACRDEILRLIKEFESKITMEIEIDPRIHARIIGSGGTKLQQIQKEYNVEIKFQANNQPDKVHIIGLDQEKIDACIEHLSLLEEEFIQDLPFRPSTNVQNQNDFTFGQSKQQQQQQQQEVPTNTHHSRANNKSKSNQQTSFQVKNAPWTNGSGYENDYQSQHRNGHDNSPKKTSAPNRDDLKEYPSFSNGLSSKSDDNSSELHAAAAAAAATTTTTTTVNPIPAIWGPQKRK